MEQGSETVPDWCDYRSGDIRSDLSSVTGWDGVGSPSTNASDIWSKKKGEGQVSIRTIRGPEGRLERDLGEDP